MSKDIKHKGNPASQVWVIAERPYPQDEDKGYIFSAGYGFFFDKMMRDAGLDNYYVISRRQELDSPQTFTIIENDLNHYQPPIIIALESAGKYLCDELEQKFRKNKSKDEDASDIEKYAGSLLVSPKLNYPHYILPTFAPDTIVKDYSQRDIIVSLDLGKAKDELEFFRKNGRLNPLPVRELKYDIQNFDELCSYLTRFQNASILSNDIETVYTNTQSSFYPHPGYPVTVGLADSVDFGISFNLFREDPKESRELWRKLDQLLQNIPQLGQNFFNFDSFRYEALGFKIPIENIQDTLIRHHILWPELPHKLQFLTRQYTREPYYKDEGKMWNMKDMKNLRRYNCLDVCVTMEVYLAQEKEFAERPHLL